MEAKNKSSRIEIDEKVVQSLPAIRNNGFIWIDMQRPNREDVNIAAKAFGLHELNVEDSFSRNQLPKIDQYPNYIFMILHFPILQKEKGDDIPKASQLSFFAGDHYLVTIHQDSLKPLVEIFEICKTDEKQKNEIMGKSPGYLIHSIIDAMVDDLLHTLRKTIGNLDDIEDLVFDNTSAARQISLLRREITVLRRVALPMKRTLVEFISRDMPRLSEEDLSIYYADIRDHVDKVLASLEEAKEMVEIYKDIDFKLSQEKSNKILAILTIIFTYTIPSMILSSFFGLNINVPGTVSSSEHWTFFGPYTTLIIIIIGSVIPAFFMHLYFRRNGWFNRSY